MDNYRERLTRELMTRWSLDELGDDRPPAVFLVGFPRSGTTMTEQVLAAHAGLLTSNEQPLLRPVREEMSRMIDVTEAGDDVCVGGQIAFAPSYGALLAAMDSEYVEARYRGNP